MQTLIQQLEKLIRMARHDNASLEPQTSFVRGYILGLEQALNLAKFDAGDTSVPTRIASHLLDGEEN